MLQPSKHLLSGLAKIRQGMDIVRANLRYRLYRWSKPARKPLSKSIIKSFSNQDEEFRNMSCTFAIVAISARIACADGHVTREKYIAFRESFPLKANMCSKIRSLFTLACTDETPLDHYVKQIKYIYPERDELYVSIVNHLFRIASGDGALSWSTERILAELSHGLGIAPSAYNQILARYAGPVKAHQAHHVLGVSSHAKPGILKERYRELMRNYHPDRFSGDNLSPELETLLKLKASEINDAYRALSKRAA